MQMNPYASGRTEYASERISAAAASLMTKVYVWMTLGLLMTALSALVVANNEEWVFALAQNSMSLMALVIGELALVWILSSRIMRMSFATAGLMFAAYSILNGVTLSFIFLVYSIEAITTTFFITAGMFGAMALVGSITKRDLSGMGRFLSWHSSECL